ncbi:MAG: hypothetical protein JXA15_14360 [Spirochaetales bacterium]|nr:hypothetical protein [Spirochaetales bacterium]
MAAAALVALAACSPGRPDTADGAAPWPAGFVAYAAEPTILAAGRVRAAASLAVDLATGEVLVRLALERGRSPVALDGALASLATDEGTEAPLASLDGDEAGTAPGPGEAFTLRFLPVTDPAAYARYGLAGAPSVAYRLDSLFIRDAEGRRLFEGGFEFFPTEGARAALQRESTRLSSLAPFAHSGGAGDFAARQAAYMEDVGLFPEAHGHGEGEGAGADAAAAPPAAAPPAGRFVLVSGDEFWLDRWLVKVSPYRIGEDLFARVRVVSKTPVRLSLDWSRVVAEAGGAAVAPSGVLREAAGRVGNAVDPVPPPSELGQNGRAELTLVWPGLGAAVSGGFGLRLDGVATTEGVPLFGSRLDYAIEAR